MSDKVTADIAEHREKVSGLVMEIVRKI